MRRSIIFVAILMFAAACGNDNGDVDQFAEATASPASDADTTMQRCEDREIPEPEQEDGPGKEKPEVEVPEGAPPCDLVIQDIHEGDGEKVEEGATVRAHYVGVSWSTGKQFDASWERGEPTEFSLLEVIPGWQEGIPGMREGGRRRLIIPPDLGYGAEGFPPDIAGGETLIFVVDMVDAG